MTYFLVYKPSAKIKLHCSKMVLPIALLSVLCCASAIGESDPAESAWKPVFVMDAQRGNGRIIGGDSASPVLFPYQASLYVNGQFYCGGSIISRRHILTAAHCLRGHPNSYTVQVGSVKLNQGRTYKVSRVIPHPQYDPQTYTNDIGVAKLASALNFNVIVQKISLETNMPQAGLAVISSGWGKTIPDDDNSIASDLQYVRLWVVRSCPATNHPGTLCAKASQGKGMCSGDSGGPLVIANKTLPFSLVGVNSFVYLPCGQTRYPDGFANVSYFVDWIKQNMI